MQHRDIPDGQRHEPKGISTASAGQVYVANGNGSGAWIDKVAYGQLTTEDEDYVIATAGAFVDVNGLDEGLSKDVTLNGTDGTLVVVQGGVYNLSMNAVASTNANQKRDIRFRFLVNNVAGTRTITTTSLETNEKLHVGGKAFISLSAGDTLKIQVTTIGGTATVNLSGMDLSLQRIA